MEGIAVIETRTQAQNILMNRVLIMLVCLLTGWLAECQTFGQDNNASTAVICVVGAAGSAEFEGEFQSWANPWEELAQRQHWNFIQIHEGTEAESPKQQLQNALVQMASQRRLFIVLLGHGTFSQNSAKFNLIGPDVSDNELHEWTRSLPNEKIVINCSSCSAPFLTRLSSSNCTVITATQSGNEYNYARFGKYFSQVISDLSNDLDHDNEVSLLEAFLAASKLTERFYQDSSRLATEHALLNDNGDRMGTGSSFYKGVRPVKSAKKGQLDGEVAARIILFASPDNAVFSSALEAQRTELEQRIDALRNQKDSLESSLYYEQLETLLLELAAIYDKAEQQRPAE